MWLIIVVVVAIVVYIIWIMARTIPKGIPSDYTIDYTFPTKIVGVTFNGVQNILPTLRSGMKLVFVRERHNAYDKNAIAVYCSGRKIGHLSADLAADIAPLMDSGVPVRGEILNVTGGGIKNYGCNINVEVYKLKDSTPTIPPPSKAQLPRLSDLTCQVENIDKSNPFYEKKCILIGFGKERIDMAQAIINLGGVLRSSVSGKTDYVIMKDASFLNSDSGNIGKLKELMNSGGKVRIMYPEEFEEIIKKYL